VRADGRDTVTAAVQQRVVGADGGADEGLDEASLLAVAGAADADERRVWRRRRRRRLHCGRRAVYGQP
jgi:hypothetical protein